LPELLVLQAFAPTPSFRKATSQRTLLSERRGFWQVFCNITSVGPLGRLLAVAGSKTRGTADLQAIAILQRLNGTAFAERADLSSILLERLTSWSAF
jgi:hypothetical protein